MSHSPLALLDPPESLVLLAGLLTQLGDLWFVLGLLTVLYWSGFGTDVAMPAHRRSFAQLSALALATFGAVFVLKTLLAVPRPPGAGTIPELVPPALEPLWAGATSVDSPRFPSGHAALSTAAYAGIASRLDRFGPRVRWGGAAALVLVIAWTRLALGVHVPVDVVAGAAVGLALFLVYELGVDRVEYAFAGAGLAGLAAVLVSLDPDAFWVLGLSVGGLLGWGLGDPRSYQPAAVQALAGLSLVVIVVGIGYGIIDHVLVALLSGTVAGAILLGLPAFGRRFQ